MSPMVTVPVRPPPPLAVTVDMLVDVTVAPLPTVLVTVEIDVVVEVDPELEVVDLYA